MKKMRNIIEKAIAVNARAKPDNSPAHRDAAFRQASAAILESLLAEMSENEVAEVMNRHGFASYGYRPYIRALSAIAIKRRAKRIAA